MDNNQLNSAFILSDIFKRYAQGETLDERDTALLERWMEENKPNEKLLSQLKDPDKVAHSLYFLDKTNTEGRLVQLTQRIQQRKRAKRIYKIASIAALVALTASFAIYSLYYTSSKPYHEQTLTSPYGDDVLPAGNKATLTLSSGSTFELRDDEQGVIISENEIAYKDGKSIGDVSTAEYATLSTPRGGQYHVTLSDGSKVSLNAGSTLEYPLNFTGNERRVELKGEAYFEVSRDASKPFVVKTEQQEVKVLGTVFNVEAYSIKETTTLVNGKVLVKDLNHQKEVQLSPNTQAIVHEGKISTRAVDATDYIGWKSGMFQGEHLTLQHISKELERWYDVDFIYPLGFKNEETAFIIIKRDEKLSAVLKTLETTYGVHFQIKGKEVFVK